MNGIYYSLRLAVPRVGIVGTGAIDGSDLDRTIDSWIVQYGKECVVDGLKIIVKPVMDKEDKTK